MATSPSIDTLSSPQESGLAERATAGSGSRLLVCLPSLSDETLHRFVTGMATVFRPEEVLLASPDIAGPDTVGDVLPLTSFESRRASGDWVLTACDYSAAHSVAQKHDAPQVLLLGTDGVSLPVTSIRSMADELLRGADMVLPSYALGPHDGLVTSALLYPITRALFSANIRFPLPMNAAMSKRMMNRIGTIADRFAGSQPESLLWPVSEGATTGFGVRQVDADSPAPPAPAGSDFNTLFVNVAGSLFSDIDAKAPFWQRSRSPATRLREPASGMFAKPNVESIAEELSSMVDQFRLAHKNLQEIWSLALPPQSLLALKKLATAEPDAFFVAPALWARLVYDFALAYHLRSLNRGHLMGSFTPLYLAWVASTLRLVTDDATASMHREETAAAFEREKPYLVARWRWPDRFNP